MAGHSHAKNVKRIKDADAQKRAVIFAKIGKNITLLVKQGGRDNPALRPILEKARATNMPKDNVEKAIKRGLGETEKENLEEFLFEAYGPAGVAIIAQGITDNKNRAILNFKKIVTDHGGKIADPGSVKWLFEQKGLVSIDCSDCSQIELAAVELDIEDIKEREEGIDIITAPDKLNEVRLGLEKITEEIDSYLVWLPLNPINLNEENKEKINRMLNDFELNEDIEDIFLNTDE